MSSIALLLVLIAFVGGLSAGLQGSLAGVLERHVGIMGSVFLIHAGGAVFSLPFLLSARLSRLAGWRTTPWYALVAGALGLILLGALAYCIPRLGVASTLTLVVVGQMTMATFLDHYGIFVLAARPLDPARLLGLLLLLLGTWFIVR